MSRSALEQIIPRELSEEQVTKIFADSQSLSSRPRPIMSSQFFFRRYATVILDTIEHIISDTHNSQVPDYVLVSQAFFFNGLQAKYDLSFSRYQARRGHYATLTFREGAIVQHSKSELQYITTHMHRIPTKYRAAVKRAVAGKADRTTDALLSSLLRSALKSGKSRDFEVALRVCFPAPEDAVLQRMRINHRVLTNILLSCQREMHWTRNYNLKLLMKCAGVGLYSLSCLVLSTMSSPHQAGLISSLASRGTFSYGLDAFIDTTKALHDLARRCTLLPPELVSTAHSNAPTSLRYTDAMYLNTLAGRFHDHTVIEKDTTISARQVYYGEHLSYDHTVGRFTPEAFLRKQAKYIATTQHPARAAFENSRIRTASDWLYRFLSFGASGSATTSGSRSLGFDRSVSKTFWLSAQSPTTFRALVSKGSPPTAQNRLIWKRENGKERALLASDLTHWFKESIVINEIESAIFKALDEVPLEMNASQEYAKVTQRRKDVMDMLAIVDTDYADFNITHVFNSFRRYYLALADIARAHIPKFEFIDGINKAEYYAATAEWCAQAYNDMWMAKDAKTPHERLSRGLWSGWRTTQFYNTIFNVIYARIAREDVTAMFPESEIIRMENVGDDSHGVANAGISALRFASVLSEQDHDLNPSKQLIDGSAAEFLRVHYAQDGAMRGAINRSISGYVGSDLQKAPNRSSRDACSGAGDALISMQRRGFSYDSAAIVLSAVLDYWGTFVHSDGRKMRVPDKVMFASTHNGGFGVNRYAQPAILCKESLPPYPEFRPSSEVKYNQPAADSFVSGFASYVYNKGSVLFDPQTLRSALADATMSGQNYDFLPGEVYRAYNDSTYEWACSVQGVKLTQAPCPPLHASDAVSIETALVQLSTSVPEVYDTSTPEEIVATLRSLALGPFAAADTHAYSTTKPVDAGSFTEIEKLMLMLTGTDASSQFELLRQLVPYPMYTPLLRYRYHIPANIAGVMPAEFRAVHRAALNRVLRRLTAQSRPLYRSTDDSITPSAILTVDDSYVNKYLSTLTAYLHYFNVRFMRAYLARGLHRVFML
uniref:RNA-directed RNA polymerase n=1 Tax=Rhizoctonia cerealis megabirnavirus-like virus TaxID=3068669 RepID=A0AA51GGU3_9VIRU|nr:MAG: RNA-dependent RNA polymerase [Rhizoctonia cerealis megabirnavirus-like virus]